jgi:membrane protein implicated in regulation of membrane protease activity
MGAAPEYAAILLLALAAFAVVYFGECFWWWARGGLRGGVDLGVLLYARLRGVPARAIVEARLLGAEGDVELPIRDLMRLHRSGVNTLRASTAVVAARAAGLDFSLTKAAAVAFEGRDPILEVRELVRARDERLRTEAQNVSLEDAQTLVGANGEVAFAVPPPGVVTVNGNRVCAVSDGGYIDKGAPVEVVSVEGTVAVVRQAAPARQPTAK